MNTSGFDQYYDESVEPGRRERAYAWATAIGLQDVKYGTKTADSMAGLHRKLPIDRCRERDRVGVCMSNVTHTEGADVPGV